MRKFVRSGLWSLIFAGCLMLALGGCSSNSVGVGARGGSSSSTVFGISDTIRF